MVGTDHSLGQAVAAILEAAIASDGVQCETLVGLGQCS